MTRASVLSAILLLALCPNAALAWLRSTHEDATIVERSELIVVAHLKPGSIQKIDHDKKPGEGASWEHHATLVITTVLKGKCDKKEIPVIVHYGLTPVERAGAKGGIEIFDTGSSAGRGGSLVKDAGQDNLWFLRKRSGTFGREPGTGDFGVVDPEDVQSLELKSYFLSYMDRDPEAAVKAFAGKNPDVAERSKRYMDHLAIQRILKTEDAGKRYDALLPFFLTRTTWNMKEEATEGSVACGATAGERLKTIFTDPKYRNFRSQIIRMWRDMGYREIAPVLIALLKEHDRFWAAQDLKKGWWSDNSNPELTRQRQDIYGEVYAAAYTLRAFRDPKAKDALELTRTRWAAINFDNKQIVEECEGALRELAVKVSEDEDEVATQIKALSDTNSVKRASAAEVLRRIVARYQSGTVYLASKDGGEAAWRAKCDRVEPGMAKAEVLKLLPAFEGSPDGLEIASGDSHVVCYRLDYHWIVRISYRNTDKVIERPVLMKSALRVHPVPPKDFTGTWTTWHVNGQKGYEIQYKDGQYDGVFATFHDNGSKSTVQHYANQNAHGPGAGWNPDGTVSYTIQYRNGKQDGRWTHWYTNGKKHSEADYVDGKYHGRVTNWHENGQIGSVNDYKDGVKHGREASWDQKGSLQYDRKFVNGEIIE